MTAFGWITLGTSIGIVAPWLFIRVHNRSRNERANGGAARAQAAKARSIAKNPHAAVSLWPCLEACSAAWKMQGERFLVGKEPFLPLAGCNQANCSCRYSEHDDRRTGEERRDNWGRFGGIEPHTGNDKRASDTDRRGNSSSN